MYHNSFSPLQLTESDATHSDGQIQHPTANGGLNGAVPTGVPSDEVPSGADAGDLADDKKSTAADADHEDNQLLAVIDPKAAGDNTTSETANNVMTIMLK